MVETEEALPWSLLVVTASWYVVISVHRGFAILVIELSLRFIRENIISFGNFLEVFLVATFIRMVDKTLLAIRLL